MFRFWSSLTRTNGGKGGLFERFLARHLAEQYGFESPTSSNLNVTSEGMSFDVTARHKLTGGQAIAECKAYNRREGGGAGGLLRQTYDRALQDADAFGLMVALPRLTADGEEKAGEIRRRTAHLSICPLTDIGTSLRRDGAVAGCPNRSSTPATTRFSSQSMVLRSLHRSRCAERTPRELQFGALWRVGAIRRDGTLSESDYTLGNTGLRTPGTVFGSIPSAAPAPAPLLARVVGSGSDFEYQLPHSQVLRPATRCC